MVLAARSGKIRALLVDDEPLALCNLNVLLRRDPAIEIVGECGSGAQALVQIRAKTPELLFLDVQMPELDGFDVLERLGSLMPPAVVFVSAYDHYALRAFEAGALDYLLKPFDDQRFNLALGRAKERIGREAALPRKLERLAVKTGGRVLFLRVAEIDWVEAADYYVSVHLGARSYLLRRSMAEVDADLADASFCRIHRSAIVNLDRIRALEVNKEGAFEVVLIDGTRLRLSRRYRKHLQMRLQLRAARTP